MIEAELRAKTVNLEVTLDQIYDSLGTKLKWNIEQRRIAQDLEMECEMIACRPIDPITNKARDQMLDNERVVVISDFYSPETFVHKLLLASGFSLSLEDVSVSCDRGATKMSGELFGVVAKRYNTLPTRLTHTGDHPISDVRMAKRAGAAVLPYENGKASSAEFVLANNFRDTGAKLGASLIAGAARRARINTVCSTVDASTWALATGIAGPLLFGYVHWILTEAKERKLPRLYFLARDGQILLRIAKEIKAKYELDIELLYLPASRSAWFLASNARGTAEDRTNALLPDGVAIIADVLKRIDISSTDVRPQLEASGFGEVDDLTRMLAEPSEISRLRSMLSTPPLSELIAKRAEYELAIVDEYLSAKKMFDGKPIVIVDIGWKGRLQQALARIVLIRGSSERPTGFYLGLREFPPEVQVGLGLRYFENHDALKINPSLAEIFCAADHGTVIRYGRLPSGQVTPVLAEPEASRDEKWNLALFHRGIVSFSDHMLDAMPIIQYSAAEWRDAFRVSTLASTRRLVAFPSAEEATLLGSYPHSSNQFHSASSDLAPTISYGRFFLSLANPARLGHIGHWREGSIARSIALPRLALRLWQFRLGLGLRIRRLIRLDTTTRRSTN
jgi:hypothetical protein